MFDHIQLTKSVLAAATLALFLCSCSSVVNSHTQKEEMMREYLNGDFEKVNQKIDAKLTSASGSGDELMWQLEAGNAAFLEGSDEKAIRHFSDAERLIQEYDDRPVVSIRDMTSEGAVLLSNLNLLPYRGFYRDRIMLGVYKSLSYLGRGEPQSFRAQLNRVREEQKQVVEKYRSFLEQEKEDLEQTKRENAKYASQSSLSADQIASDGKNRQFQKELNELQGVVKSAHGNFLNPVALFLTGISAIRDENYENAVIDFRHLYEAMPENLQIQQYYVTVLKYAGRAVPESLKTVKPFPFPLGRNCVFVLFANGRGVALKQTAIYFPVMTAWGMCEYYSPSYSDLTVKTAVRTYRTQSLANLDAVFSQEYDRRLPGIITRTVLSTLIKEGASYTGAWAVSEVNGWAGAGVLLGSMVWRAVFNTADTRSWELLPKEVQLTQFPMPPGRKIELDAGGVKKTVIVPDACDSAIIYVNAPSSKVVQVRVFQLP